MLAFKVMPCPQMSPPESTDKTKYLLELHERSKNRANGWPNTLEVRSAILVLHHVTRYPSDISGDCFHSAYHFQAQRQRKDRARRERLAASEAVKAQVLSHVKVVPASCILCIPPAYLWCSRNPTANHDSFLHCCCCQICAILV